jgi:hypothetical protein
LCFVLECRKIDDFQETNNNICKTPSSEPSEISIYPFRRMFPIILHRNYIKLIIFCFR